MGLEDELLAAAQAAAALARDGEALAGIIPAEPRVGLRVYLCAYEPPGAVEADGRAWLALDGEHTPVADRQVVRDAASIVAACELAEECAGGGDVARLRTTLMELRLSENPEGIEEAEQAAAALEFAIEPPPRVARPEYLDSLGQAATVLEVALGEQGPSPFARAMQVGMGAVEEFVNEVERGYRGSLG